MEIQGGSFGLLPAWNVVLIPSFLIFFIAGVAETNRAPFDLVEAESEIVGGYQVEYTGFDLVHFGRCIDVRHDGRVAQVGRE